ncbi:hypothetical protein CGGC5_v016016 [Colletotrichum fructicola Nara gc5]|uniref:Uncharacterized protein n=1 Tax=Colletotrichum fructicola (strain Nara gc5) TaxID=1213859 RepID=A0A7J6IG20_COLFN|nr:hypothetical protein CGGC5_v016016 [Colletotrichum fructicola Nara gc5]
MRLISAKSIQIYIYQETTNSKLKSPPPSTATELQRPTAAHYDYPANSIAAINIHAGPSLPSVFGPPQTETYRARPKTTGASVAVLYMRQFRHSNSRSCM